MKAAYTNIQLKLIKSGGGAFEVLLEGEKIFSKLDLDRFPAYAEIPELLADY